jgi:transcriptional regulator with XRE-family HTH domain
MVARNKLSVAPPYSVEMALKRLGVDLRTARLRRNLTIEEVAQKIGTGPRAVVDAEKGKPTTSVSVYTAMLWTFDLLNQLDEVARPENDEQGQVLALSGERSRARIKMGLDNDF